MNGLFLAAAILAVSIGIAHSWLGERYLLIRLFRRQDQPQLLGSSLVTKRTLRFAWHLTTVAWCGFGVLLAWHALTPGSSSPVAAVAAATFGLSALVAYGGSRGRHLSWAVFLTIALLTAMGLIWP